MGAGGKSEAYNKSHNVGYNIKGVVMRKKSFFAAACFVLVCSTFLWATETLTSDLYYIYVPIVRVQQNSDGYVIYFQKKDTGIGKTYIPKKWYILFYFQ